MSKAELSRRAFASAAVSVGASGIAGGMAPAAAQPSSTAAGVLTAANLGARCDGIADDGAILSAALEARFATLRTQVSHVPVEIDLEGRTYTLKSPIYIRQNLVRVIGRGARLNCRDVAHAVVCDVHDAKNNLIGVQVKGITIAGSVREDAVLVKAASQCEIEVRNKGRVGGAVVHIKGSYACQITVFSDHQGEADCSHAYRESVLETDPGKFYNCIANTAHVLSYHSNQAGVALEESDAFRVTGDIEQSRGSGVDLLNCRFGFVSVYTEANGQQSRNVGLDTPDDIRIRSQRGRLVSRCSNISIMQSTCGGEAVRGAVPTNIHVIAADGTCIVGNNIAGRIVIEEGADRTHVGVQARMLQPLVDKGNNTVDFSGHGRQVFMANAYQRLVIDSQSAGGARIGGGDNLLSLYGLVGLSMGQTLARNFAGFIDIKGPATAGAISFGTAEADAHYIPQITIEDLSGSSASRGVVVTGKSRTGMIANLDAPPGPGQTVRVYWTIVRAS